MGKIKITIMLTSLFLATQVYAQTYTIDDTWINWPGNYTSNGLGD